ncbi:MAG: aromatic amino acid DMT transporter YddG [Candidatus Brocadiaceae bacterium]|nr:aromatic amino acid DMT transporter YddG [Candidatus Brocadiaceae bacterium]
MEKTEGVHSHAPLNTVFGFIAIACWSSTIAFTRTASEFLGPVTMGAFMFLVAGVAGCALLALQRGGLVSALKLPPAYLLGCGALFVCCELGLCLAVGRAVTRQQVLEVSVINYLWPGLTLLFSVWILKRRARLWLMPGVVIALTGVLLAMSHEGRLSWSGLAEGFLSAPAPYLLALGAAVSWGLYSNLSRRWAGNGGSTGVPFFFLATAGAFFLLRLFVAEQPQWSPRALWELLFLALVPNLLGYTCWDLAMRNGRIILVAAFSYLTPVLSMFVSSLRLGIRPGLTLWVACAMVVVGAVVCKLSISDD